MRSPSGIEWPPADIGPRSAPANIEAQFGSVEYFEKLLAYDDDLPPELARLHQGLLVIRLIENRVGDGEPMAEIRAILTAYRKVTNQ